MGWFSLIPIVIQLLASFFKSKEERQKARARFQKFMQEKKWVTQIPVETRRAYKKLRDRAKQMREAKEAEEPKKPSE